MQQRGVLVCMVVFAVALALVFSLVPVLAANETTADATTAANVETVAETTAPVVATDVSTSTSTNTQASAGASNGATKNAETTTEASVNTDVKFERGAGITPDSALYPVEKFFENFRGDGSNREKKFAEIKAMIEEKNYEAARVALARYREYADKLEKNVAPEDREEAQRSAAAIRNALKELEGQIPAEQKKEFFDNIRDKETSIDRAAEVAAKIKELCETLAKLDPAQYAKVCKTNKDAPQWQKNLDDKLTDEQREAAKLFGKVMKQCMNTQGKECACDELRDISTPFAEKCSLVAPLAAKCEGGDEESCAIMEDATADMENLLPPYLQDVLADIEGDIRGEQFNNFMPPECKKAGAKTPKECMRIMFEENAPEECIAAAKGGKIDFTSERTMRESCEELMFEENAPEKCKEAGLKNHKECGRFMFAQNAPKECIEAGITGEKPNDPRKCEELMRSQRGNEGSNKGQGKGFALGRNCKEIQDIGERFKCYEEAYDSVQTAGFPGQGPENFGSFNDDFASGEDNKRGVSNRGPGGSGFPEQCAKAGATTREACEKIMRAEGDARFQKTRDYQENFARECRAKNGRWDCSYGWSDASNPCRCFTDEQHREGFQQPPREGSPRPPEGFQQPPREDFRSPENYQRPPEGQYPRPPEGTKPPEGFQQPPPSTTTPPPTTTQPPSSESTSGTTSGTSAGTSTSTSTGTASGGTTSSETSTSTSTSTSSGGSTGTSAGTSTSTSTTTSSGGGGDTSSSTTTTAPTGAFITGNAFLEYYFNR